MTNQEINEQVARKMGTLPECQCSDALHKAEARHFIPDYSGSIAAAWELVGKFDKFVLARAGSDWVASNQWEPGVQPLGIADTAPMAICLAFLKLP